MNKCILILLDGLGDRSFPALGHQTPLQAAHTPNLNALAAHGSNGLFHAQSIGLALPSENAHFAMFGYTPEEFPGRGYLEALGAGLNPTWNQIALLAHFVWLEEKNSMAWLRQQRPDCPQTDVMELIRSISSYETGGIRFSFHHTHKIDGILLLEGDLSHHITDTDPLRYDTSMLAAQPLHHHKDDKQTQATCKALNRYLSWCFHQLDAHGVNRDRNRKRLPLVNGLVTQRAGRKKQVQSFTERWGLKGASLASGLIYWGLGHYLGMKVCRVDDTENPGADIAYRFRLATSLLDQYDFIHVHTKMPDVAGHKKDPAYKVEVIESLDRGLKSVLHWVERESGYVIITADHSTPSSGSLIHSGEPVPLTLVGSGVRRDLVSSFSEIHCGAGALGSISGKDIMPMILNCLDMIKLRGLMDSPEDQMFWPGNRSPFRLQASDKDNE